MTMTAMDYLRKTGTHISCDTMDSSIAKGKVPKYFNATSNQIISHNTLQNKVYNQLMPQACKQVVGSLPKDDDDDRQIDAAVDIAMAKLGKIMADQIDGCVMTQTAPSKAFDTQGTIDHAKKLVKAFGDAGVDKSRLIIKIPASWEGLQACKELESQGISTLATMVFSLVQGQLAGVYKCREMAPYVNGFELLMDRELWKKKYQGSDFNNHPGVLLTRKIQAWYRANGIKTLVCAAAVIDPKEAVAMGGIDELTLSPEMLDGLNEMNEYSEAPGISEENVFENPEAPSTEESKFRFEFARDRYAGKAFADALNAFYDCEVKLQDMARECLKP